MREEIKRSELESLLAQKLEKGYGVAREDATDEILYKALASVIKDYLAEKRRKFSVDISSHGRKRVYYICMEFLLGRSLKNNLFNLGIEKSAREVLKKTYDANLDALYEQEPDAGLGNGGLGRLAACFMDSLAALEYPATGYSILYEFGIFKQRIIDGWQTELPDNWLPGGEVWLTPRPDQTSEVHFGGEIQEFWDYGYHYINYVNYKTVEAVPYDMYVSGYDSKGVTKLRLFKAKSPSIDMGLFNSGDYARAINQNAMAEVISKILYPNDNHIEGKQLRLEQQYFLVCAALNNITTTHLKTYGTMDNFHEKVAIQLNDTHPALMIPELMRVLLDECGYSWDKAYDITINTFSYTNHTVMSEALEVWNEDLFRTLLPRHHQILKEIDNRFAAEIRGVTDKSEAEIAGMTVISKHQIRMANLSVIASHAVNGVSAIHSQIIKDDVFSGFYSVMPKKFKNVTNGISSRRWLNQSNHGLTELCNDLLGSDYVKNMTKLEGLRKYQNDAQVLERLGAVKRENKENFAKYLKSRSIGIIDPASMFDVQVKRMHEYKRQHLNALNIISLYQKLLDNPQLDIVPQTFIFGAKAAPGYYLAKQIIRLICQLQKEIEKRPDISEKLRIVYLEDYKVSLSEVLMPASEVSEQISLAGTEASGTGNMKLMLNGAITLGTLDGANIEIKEACGDENIIIFGMNAQEAKAAKAAYRPIEYYNGNPDIKRAIDLMVSGVNGNSFEELANSLKNSDPYMVLKDFESYREARGRMTRLYREPAAWNRMSLNNIAGAGRFSADEAIRKYAADIWRCN
ncbi:MAG: glycogen/starch/alpha-glucan phosphorylase [Oscillospiraceae bacterium]|jgi:starch phosphorylase|nr:glycogen/starch/alpha-glucan phosphorylase [Oscillospiraceae bacterium]